VQEHAAFMTQNCCSSHEVRKARRALRSVVSRARARVLVTSRMLRASLHVRACAGDSGSATHICLAGEQCGAVLLPTKSGGQGPPPYAHGVGGYFGLYGTGQFDGQLSGHDFLGTVSILCSSPPDPQLFPGVEFPECDLVLYSCVLYSCFANLLPCASGRFTSLRLATPTTAMVAAPTPIATTGSSKKRP
jgi:hypothetical protein